jgi:hypothetical protein
MRIPRLLWSAAVAAALCHSTVRPLTAIEDEVFSTMNCTISGAASSTFWFGRPGLVQPRWSGKDPYREQTAYPHFEIQVPVSRAWFTELLFSKLDSPTPVVRPLFAERSGVEAKATVLERQPSVIVLLFRWASTWHSVVINFNVRKATIAGVGSDSVGVGGSIRTADCK